MAGIPDHDNITFSTKIICQADNCGYPVIEYFESEEYPLGAYRLIARHHGRKDENIFPIHEKPAIALTRVKQ